MHKKVFFLVALGGALFWGCSDDSVVRGAGDICPSGNCNSDNPDKPDKPDDPDKPDKPDDPDKPDNPDPTETSCGNSEIDSGELCDDGNQNGGDGCSSDCKTIEPGYVCDTPGNPCIPEECGNGIVDEGEECDLGFENVEYGSSEDDCSIICQKAHYCGDGLWDKVDKDNGEECDAGENASDDYNGCTAECKRASYYCGDGLITHSENCDDGNGDSGDGCSAECKVEEGYYCPTPGESCKSKDSTNCGNGSLDSGESCDDGNDVAGDGCSAVCVIEPGWLCEDGKNCVPTVCGDGKIEGSENCEDGNNVSGDGCSDKCLVESGWACSSDGCHAQMCGDGIIAGDEECDDKNTNSGDGCNKYCHREAGFHCDTAGMPCEADKCGDGVVTGDETCDEGSAGPTDGCKACQVQMGWKCPTPGSACEKADCGNGVLEGAETCEEDSECCKSCTIQTHCLCDENGKNCKLGKCGNGTLEAGEQCDDGNLNAGDGCDPVCKSESVFICTKGGCKPVCGDGITIWEAGEECDDGNLISGDGCSSECKIEEGFACTKYSKDYPDTIKLPVTYRDFRSYEGTSSCTGATAATPIDGCIDESHVALYHGNFKQGHGHPDFERVNANEKDMVKTELGSDGLPVFNKSDNTGLTKESFDMWYRDYPGINKTFKDNLELTCTDKTSGKYVFNSSTFFPLSDKGYGNEMAGYPSQNFHFTTHIQTYFKYRGNDETLDFSGDDDVWVFVNGVRAIDIGGCHGETPASFVLKGGDPDPTTGKKHNTQFNLYEDGIYPISFFHAERHTGASNFKLTLTGFLDMGTSSCDAICGDGLVRGDEECDIKDHIDDDTAKKAGCVKCKITPYCGNGKIETGEQCDGGAGCTADCKYENDQCGNGTVEAPETCDDGAKNGTAESNCMANCQLAGCGNGIVEDGEECDDGNTSDDDNCSSKCKKPFCGDGIVQGWIGEVCDDGTNDGSYNGCGLGCSYFPPRCGDAIVDTMNGEECDDGVNDGSYNTCSPECKLVDRCGDGIIQEEYGETCDEGDQNGNGSCGKYCQYEIN